MIIDSLANAALYRSVSPVIARAFDYVLHTNFAAMADGKHPVEGDEMFAMVQRYKTRPPGQGRWEAHLRYIDLQVVISGIERVGYGHISRFTAAPYDAEIDVTFPAGTGDFVTATEGTFLLLWPEDVHMPGIEVDEPTPVLKVVVKIAIVQESPVLYLARYT
jgi:YhcH/YjgK/YiaL family protein